MLVLIKRLFIRSFYYISTDNTAVSVRRYLSDQAADRRTQFCRSVFRICYNRPLCLDSTARPGGSLEFLRVADIATPSTSHQLDCQVAAFILESKIFGLN